MNRWRSPSAEQIFAEHPGTGCSSAGLNQGADNPLTPELLAWADLIFVMERSHKDKLGRDFKAYLLGKHVICLNVPDHDKFMDPALIKLLHAKVDRFLSRATGPSA